MRAKRPQTVEIKQIVRRPNCPQTCAATVQLINVPSRQTASRSSCISPRIVEALTRPLQQQCIVQTNAGRVGKVKGEGSPDEVPTRLVSELLSC
jgi:hypothetical protein